MNILIRERHNGENIVQTIYDQFHAKDAETKHKRITYTLSENQTKTKFVNPLNPKCMRRGVENKIEKKKNSEIAFAGARERRRESEREIQVLEHISRRLSLWPAVIRYRSCLHVYEIRAFCACIIYYCYNCENVNDVRVSVYANTGCCCWCFFILFWKRLA